MPRKLTQQQQRRIQSLQEKKQILTTTSPSHLGEAQQGLLIMRHGRTALVENAQGEVISCHLRQNLTDMAPGDKLIWQADETGSGVITAILPRQSIWTKTIGDEKKVLAANISCLVIVFAPEPAPTPGLLDKYLLAAELMKLNALLVLNKSDLCPAFPAIFEELALYQSLAYPFFQLSLVNGQGFSELKAALQNETSIVLGQSGVGKSSLIQALLPGVAIRVGSLSAATRFGKHTTSNARFYHLPSGGAIIDSPGVRDINMGVLTSAQIQQGFIECRDLIGQCKFRDCSHAHEPDCAVRAAVKSGKMHRRRYQRLLEWIK